MKGFALSINTVVIIIVVLLVLVVLTFFLSGGVTREVSRIEAQKTFSDSCSALCGPESVPKTVAENYVLAYNLPTSDPDFYNACLNLGYAGTNTRYQCLAQCGCNMGISSAEVNQNIQQFNLMVEAGTGI